MGLENLKSVFSIQSEKFQTSDLTKLSSEFSRTDNFQNSNVTNMETSLGTTTEFINTSVTDIDSYFDNLSEITPSSVELFETSHQINNLLSGTTFF